VRGLIVISFASMMLCGCSERWEGFVYPNKSNLETFIATGTFNSLDDCRANAIHILEQLKMSNGDYECGKNCEGSFRDSLRGNPRVCEKTDR
jgi:hypothetical protein